MLCPAFRFRVQCAAGGVSMRWVTFDAQAAPGGYIIIAVTGESSVPVSH
jgi:hypothetical protein